jgi:TetR/AcrR family transcriptional regulator
MKAADNRQRLLEVALERFASRGYDATGVQDVVDAAGVTKPTLYHYFGSKLGLLQALIQHHGASFLDDLRKATAYEGDLPLTLQRIVRAYLSFAKRQPDFYRLHMMLVFLPPHHEAREAIAPLFEEQRRLLEGMFLASVPGHGNLKGKHQRLASSLLGQINSDAVLLMDGALDESESLPHEVAKQFSYGIYA